MSYMLEVLVDRTELLILTQNRFQIRLEWISFGDVLLRKSGKHQLIKRYAYTKKTNLRAWILRLIQTWITPGWEIYVPNFQ
jgi:hypothetical protein